jgi:predicted ATPase
MHLRRLSISNFRQLKNIEVEFRDGVSVIVGPNAIGKTTILEAIRLAKALLAPRIANEAQQALMSIGASSPHNPQQLIPGAVVGDPTKPLEIKCAYEISAAEYALLSNSVAQIATDLVQARVPNATPAGIAAYLSSAEGRSALVAAETELREAIAKTGSAKNIINLNLIVDFQAGRIQSEEPLSPALIAHLDRYLSPDLTKFSYFPADRALPRGDVPMQIGAQDAAQQLESHNSQPQIKYQRLKNAIFNAIISDENGRASLRNDFATIFAGVLKGKELVSAGVNQYGLLSIRVREPESGREFDIDGLSSGEKGLILTFLTISRTVAQDGLILLDEPELHLNPAVCRDLLAFLIEAYAKPKNIQMIICSHSPEILAGAIGHDDCELFHLVSGTLLTPVRQSDEEEVTEALRRLGTSESEGLLYKATLFVEGPHDVDLLELGFGSLLRQYKIKDLGGRGQVEKQIRLLQEAASRGEVLAPRFFIFDRDLTPSSLKSTETVKVLQWDRRCLENYLIDFDILTDLLKDSEITSKPLTNKGELVQILKRLAMSHLDDVVVEQIYSELHYSGVGRRASDVTGKGFGNSASALFDRIETSKNELKSLDRNSWEVSFIAACEKRKAELLPEWDSNWRNLCDGKRLFKELQQEIQINMPLLSFKKRVMIHMRAESPPSESWRAVDGLLKNLIGWAAPG